MALIADEMYKQIESMIEKEFGEDEFLERKINREKAKEAAKMLTGLSTDKQDAENLTNQYIAGIKNICSTK